MTNRLNDDLLQGDFARRAAAPCRIWRGFPNKLMNRLSAVAMAMAIFAPSVFAAPIEILFVGNSYTTATRSGG